MILQRCGTYIYKWKRSNDLAVRLGNTILCQRDTAESMTVYKHRAGHCLKAQKMGQCDQLPNWVMGGGGVIEFFTVNKWPLV